MNITETEYVKLLVLRIALTQHGNALRSCVHALTEFAPEHFDACLAAAQEVASAQLAIGRAVSEFEKVLARAVVEREPSRTVFAPPSAQGRPN